MEGRSHKEDKLAKNSGRKSDDINTLKKEISFLKSELDLFHERRLVYNEITEEGLFFYENYLIKGVNEAFCRLTAYSSRELIGMSLEKLFLGNSFIMLKELIDSGSSNAIEIQVNTRQNTYVDVHAKAKSMEFGNSLQQLVLVQNITEFKKTRKSLDESESRHRMISRLLSDYVYTCTVTPNNPPVIGWVSGAIETICGYSSEEIEQLEHGWFSIIHPEDVQRIAESVNYNYKDEKFHDNEYRIVDKSGKIRWMQDRSMRIKYDPKTKELTLLGATKDITHSKEIEESLRLKNLESEQLNKDLVQVNQQLIDSRSKYKNLIQNSVFGIGISFNEKILFANQALLDIYGIQTFEEFASKKITDYMPPQSKKLVKERLEKYKKNIPIEKVFRHEIFKSDGSLSTLEITSTNVLYEGKKCRQVFMKDITQELETEQALQRAASIFENILHGIIIYKLEDVTDDHSLKMISCNPAALRYLKRGKDEMIEKYIDEIFPLLREKGIPQLYADIVRNQNPTELDDLYYSDSHEVEGIFAVKAFPLPGNCVGISFENVTARRKSETDLQTRNNELNNLVYKVSHDLKAPLRSIKGLIYLSKLEQNLEEHLPVIEGRINSLDHFIGDILSHARNLNTEVSTEPINMEEIINNCFEELEYLQDITTVNKTLSIKGNDFCSDKIRLTEICRNLASNSIKYCDRRKNEQYVHVVIDIKPSKLVMTFEDNGIGIKAEYLDSIFNMFYRATESEEGSGIGLYIVQQAIEKLNGKVSVVSKYGQGSTFTVEIPNRCNQVKQ